MGPRAFRHRSTVRYEVKPLTATPDEQPPEQRIDGLTLVIT
jgi:hypothetical protein